MENDIPRYDLMMMMMMMMMIMMMTTMTYDDDDDDNDDNWYPSYMFIVSLLTSELYIVKRSLSNEVQL